MLNTHSTSPNQKRGRARVQTKEPLSNSGPRLNNTSTLLRMRHPADKHVVVKFMVPDFPLCLLLFSLPLLFSLHSSYSTNSLTMESEEQDGLEAMVSRVVSRVLQSTLTSDSPPGHLAPRQSPQAPALSQPGPSGSGTSTFNCLGRLQRFNKAYKDAVVSLKSVNTGTSLMKRKSREDGLISLSKKAKAKVSSWTHRFMCLSGKDDSRIPTTTMERETLALGGLGEKKVHIPNVDCTIEEFHSIVTDHYPKLINIGGFELMRCISSSRNLELIPSPICHSPRLLRSSIGNGRVYIRPIQTDIDVTIVPVGDLPQITQECLKCHRHILLEKLREHVTHCDGSVTDDDDEIDDSIDSSPSPLPSPIPPSYNVYSPNAPPYSPIPHDFESHVFDVSSSPDFPPVTFLNNHGRSEEREEVKDLKSCIKELQSINKTFTAPHLHLEFRRDFILKDALKHSSKPKFDPKNHLKVTFVGEAGEDIGGLRREFWRLFVSAAAQEYFIGEASCKTFQPNVQALQDEVYERLGEWIAMSVVQDGFGFPMLAPSIYEYMVTGTCTCTNIPVQDIPDPRVSSLVVMICSAKTDEDLKLIFDDDTYGNVLFETGYKKPISALTLDNKEELTNVVSSYHTVIKVKAQIDQFVKGLETLDIHSYIVKFPDIMKTLFVKENEKLRAEYIKGLIKVKFSEKESSLRQREEATYMYFVDFLDECEEGSIDVSLDDVLIFLTGSDREPPLGFSRTPELKFLHDESRTMASASTCTLELKLPTCHKEYSSFCSSMKWSFQGHGGFHVV